MDTRIAAGLVVLCWLAGCAGDGSISPQRAIALAQAQMPGARVEGAVMHVAKGASIPGLAPGYRLTLRSPDGVTKDFHVSPDGQEVRDVSAEAEESRRRIAIAAEDRPELARLAKAAREQAARIASIDQQRLHEERCIMLGNGQEAGRVVELLGSPEFPVGVQAHTTNAILLISDLRATPAPRNALVATQ
jgi:hypothetical protein